MRDTKTSRWQSVTEQPVFQWSAIGLTVIISLVVLLWQLESTLIPAAVDHIIEEVPPEFFDEIGEGMVSDLASSGFTESTLTRKQQAEVHAVFDGLRKELQLDTRHTLHLYHWATDANAFALPGAQIVVTDELVHRLGMGDQLKAVLLHELGHTTFQHVEASMLRSSLIGLGSVLLIGDISYLSLAAASVSTTVLERTFSREQEIEADTYAARYFLARDEDPEALVSALQNLSVDVESGAHAWLSTHPSNEERVRLIRGAYSRGKDGGEYGVEI